MAPNAKALSNHDYDILKEGIVSRFSTSELREIYFHFGINDEDILGRTVTEKAIELILWFERRERITELLTHLASIRPHYLWPSVLEEERLPESIEVAVEVGDVLRFRCDVLVLKYAQEFYGADRAVSNALAPERWESFTPDVGDYVITSSMDKLPSNKVLFVGTVPLHLFDYAQIRLFSRQSLSILSHAAPSTRHVAMTIHGVGFGLDETECFLAQLAGILDAIHEKKYPRLLERISIVELDEARAARLRRRLSDYVQGGRILVKANDTASTAQSRLLDDVGLGSRNKRLVFVAMPFSEEFEDVYVFGISAPVNAFGYLSERVDLQSFTGDILTRIKERIETAILVIADLSGANPNVYLEVGYAWGRQRPTLLLVKKDADQLKFDVQGQKAIVYKSIKDLKQQLENFLGDFQQHS